MITKELRIIMKKQIMESMFENIIYEMDKRLLQLKKGVDEDIKIVLEDWDGRVGN